MLGYDRKGGFFNAGLEFMHRQIRETIKERFVFDESGEYRYHPDLLPDDQIATRQLVEFYRALERLNPKFDEPGVRDFLAVAGPFLNNIVSCFFTMRHHPQVDAAYNTEIAKLREIIPVL
jgi:hypothetical protein